MPTQEEKVAQVEAALRRRFFHMVPKVEKAGRENWTEAQHDTDRLTRCLAAYAIASLAQIDDTTATGTIIDGDDDFGIDALHYDLPRARLFLVQSKFKRGGAAPSQEESLKTINGVRALIARRFAEFNASFQRRLDEIEDALDTPGVVIEIALAYLGENMSPHVEHDLNALRDEINALAPRLSWESHGLCKIHGWLIADEAPGMVNIDQLTLDNWGWVPGPRKAVYGQLRAANLAALVDTHKKALFERNIRHYLGSVGVNTAIAETVARQPCDFFYLNNGLTAVAETITAAAGPRERCNFKLTKFSIVNGAQTAGSIANAALAGALSPDAFVMLTIIEIGGAGDDIGKRITKARNYQNAVRGIDFAALDPRQEHIRQVLAVAGITYHYRPSVEAKTRRDDAFTLEEAAVALACLSLPVLTSQEVRALQTQGQKSVNAVDFVVMAKKEVGRLWDQDGPAYGVLFHADLSATRMCRAVRIYRFADQVLADTERAETAVYSRRMFFRHGRYFIMAFLARRSGDVLGRAELPLSADDRNLLSQRLNDLAELIFAESAPWQGVKGYLAIFRNLTDAQPLADRVVARLAEWDRPPAPPPPANPVSPAQAGTGTT